MKALTNQNIWPVYKSFFRTNKPTNGRTDKRTHGQTDVPITMCPQSVDAGHKKQVKKSAYISNHAKRETIHITGRIYVSLYEQNLSGQALFLSNQW